jgi:hypothetical protein
MTEVLIDGLLVLQHPRLEKSDVAGALISLPLRGHRHRHCRVNGCTQSNARPNVDRRGHFRHKLSCR